MEMPRNNIKREQFKRMVSLASASLLLGVFTLCFGIVWYEYYSDAIILPFYRRGNWVLIIIYLAMLLIFSKAYGGLKIGYLKRTDMFYSQTLSILCVNVLAYLQISLISRHFAAVGPMFFLTILDLLLLLGWIFGTNKLYFHLYPPRRLVVVYGDKKAADLILKMSRRVDKYMICESVFIDESMEFIQKTILRYEGVILCDVPGRMRNDLLKFCFAKNIRTYVAPKISDIILRGAEEIRLFDTPLLLCRNYGFTLDQKIVKRTFDLIFAIVVSILALPFACVAAIAIKLDDGGPILYKQRRLTLGGKEFNVYKFRSMVVNAEAAGPQLATEEDHRITKAGKFLRKYRLDEIPQLLNILKGDMSVVGPRPERPELARQYEKTMPEFEFRLHVKAGLTGYAQVIGLYDTAPYDKLKMDLMYIESYSLLLDLRIILMTLKTALFPPASNEEQKKEMELELEQQKSNHKEQGE